MNLLWSPADQLTPWADPGSRRGALAKVNAGVSGQTFVYPLNTSFYLCEYVTISKTVDIVLEPID